MLVRMLVYSGDKVIYKSSWENASEMVISKLRDFTKGMEGQIEYEYRCN